MDHVIANGEITEVRHEGSSLRLAAKRLRGFNFRIIKEITCAKDHQVRVRQGCAFRHAGANNGCGGEIARKVCGFVEISFAAGSRIARAQAERNLRSEEHT